MEMWEQYCKEREGLHTLKTPYGFMQFRLENGECFISDTFVIPEKRRAGHLFDMADQVVTIAKEKNCNILTCAVDVTTCGHEVSLMGILKYGFKVHDLRGSQIVLYKEI